MSTDTALTTAPAQPVTAVIGLGANLGETATALDTALDQLDATEGITVQRRSPRARTAPVGGPPGQPDYLNQVAQLSTTLSPMALLRRCQQIEQEAHRVREERWGPRTLDLDIITYGDLHSADPHLTLPHPRAHTRAFVLAPWSWMDPAAMLNGQPVSQLATSAADHHSVHRIPEQSDTL